MLPYPMHLDHIVISVRDLDQAVRDYTELGFHVEPGGRHARTENALIIFADGTYLELLALQKSWKRPFIRLAVKLGLIERSAAGKTDMYWRLLRWINRGTGIVDWCVAAPNIANTLEQWQTHGNDIIPAEYFDRTRPDGKVAKWYLGGARSFDLPFLIEDISARDIRVPPASADTHPNGALGIAGLSLPVDDPAEIKTLYERLGLSALSVSFEPGRDITLEIRQSKAADYVLEKKKSHSANIEMFSAAKGESGS